MIEGWLIKIETSLLDRFLLLIHWALASALSLGEPQIIEVGGNRQSKVDVLSRFNLPKKHISLLIGPLPLDSSQNK